ncbi:hypothetical protein ASPWEDRAFT_168902 [Aspergillus wentii DTO 134E9]|uniref:Uncharacterized protein n=1 Tax=Aspergillus wentii DTO 134E9 TaxID=1073089 RepID=A0A1L9RVZ8_ASPWE|nr:uncharacterized protein ASPWEDRAFT_168902 [Aspergillus wentii DTO 134E9]KAI9929259.1 hypothetical protein MW887_001667 [Aspergillus wentii]OJJ39037.1 hypothetical protein ASPWEDRAFT_168902 [Aspergillus wentii DTO 134E9]
MAVELDTRQPDSLQPLPQPDQPLPNAAQIPLQTFHLPSFPPQASQLKDLTLTSDIKPTEYADLLATPLSADAIPSSLPASIESLTLELFSLGYPPSFLDSLSRGLPRLRALTLYSHLVDGVSDGSRKDAGEFFHNVLVGKKENGGGLRQLHLLDVFSRKGLMSGIGDILDDMGSNALIRLLEVSYTYRGHSDSGFLARIPGDELPGLLVPSLVAVSFRLSSMLVSPDGEGEGESQFPDDPADVDVDGVRIPGAKPQGIIPLHPAHPGMELLMKKLAGHDGPESLEPGSSPSSGPGPRGLKMLDCTLYTLSLEQLTTILSSQNELAILAASVLVQEKETLLDTLRNGSKDLEAVEIVGVPKEAVEVGSISNQDTSFRALFPTTSDMTDLSTRLPRLNSFTMTILRAASFGSVTWTRAWDGGWEGGTVGGQK